MNILIAATKTCNHRPILEEWLDNADLDYKIRYFEDHPELIEKFKIQRSPLLIVDDEIVSVGMPEQTTIEELKNRKNK